MIPGFTQEWESFLRWDFFPLSPAQGKFGQVVVLWAALSGGDGGSGRHPQQLRVRGDDLGLALSLESQAAQRSWLRTWGCTVLGQPRGCPGFPRGWGTLSGPGAGPPFHKLVMAPLPPQHFLIPAPNNNS